jgi:hypothetical protein
MEKGLEQRWMIASPSSIFEEQRSRTKRSFSGDEGSIADEEET